MKHLINTSHELQQYARINTSVLKESFLPYEPAARQKYLVKYLGETLHDELLTLASDNSKFPEWAESEDQKNTLLKVLDLTRAALASFVLYLASPHLDLHLSEAGFVVLSSQNMAPASAERVRNATEAYLQQGFTNIETLLRYLEKHHAFIDSYKESEAFVMANSNFINSAETFDRIVNIGGSRLKFIEEIKPEMHNFESLEVDPLISDALADQIRQQQRENDLSDANKALLAIIQRAEAHTVISMLLAKPEDQAKKDRFALYGKNYLARVKQLLDQKADDYPLYKESPQYVPQHSYTHFEYNDDESGFFVAGHP